MHKNCQIIHDCAISQRFFFRSKSDGCGITLIIWKLYRIPTTANNATINARLRKQWFVVWQWNLLHLQVYVVMCGLLASSCEFMQIVWWYILNFLMIHKVIRKANKNNHVQCVSFRRVSSLWLIHTSWFDSDRSESKAADTDKTILSSNGIE